MKRDKFLRIAAAIYFGVAGAIGATLLTFGGSGGFWYTLCGYYFALCSVAWAWRPRVAAPLSLGPVLALAWAFRYAGHPGTAAVFICLAAFLAPAVVFIIIALPRPYPSSLRPILVSLALVGLTIGVDKLYISRTVVRTYKAQWASANDPHWSDITGEGPGSLNTGVVLYRQVGNQQCFDIMWSPELLTRLKASGSHSATVQYDLFTFFGRVHGYNVRSVDGLIFNEGEREVRSGEGPGGSGGVAVNGRLQSGDCW